MALAAVIGNLFRVRKWDHHQGTEENYRTFSFSAPKQRKGEKTVLLMLVLGEVPYDETKPQPDAEKLLNDLGWYKKDV